MGIQLLRAPGPHESRTPEQLWQQYLVEKELATGLRTAGSAERSSLYSAAYEELFRRVPHHSQLTYKASSDDRARRIASQIGLLSRWLNDQTHFLEIGAGDCALSLTLATRVAQVYAVDVSPSIMRTAAAPPNFTALLSDGTSIPVAPGSITVAYSNQLMEHLHPDDALEQLANIHTALAPGGIYVCTTPNRLTGPHDISRFFDDVATCLHLKEYTCSELTTIFRRAGFHRMWQVLRRTGRYLPLPTLPITAIEHCLQSLPQTARTRALRSRLARGLLEIRLVAVK